MGLVFVFGVIGGSVKNPLINYSWDNSIHVVDEATTVSSLLNAEGVWDLSAV